jgi:hypothetical protein
MKGIALIQIYFLCRSLCFSKSINSAGGEGGLGMYQQGDYCCNVLFDGPLKWFFMATAAVLVCACSGSDENAQSDGVAEPPARVGNVPDPAMELPAQPEPEIGKPYRVDTLPTEITLNDTQDQIFLPSMGWVPLEEFWDLYENHPARLPDNLDFQAIHSIRLSLAGQDDDES